MSPPIPSGLELVSFDVFDTLVVRVLRSPTDLFAVLAARHPEVFRGSFASGRARAESAARRRSGAEEVTLAGVYDRCVEMGLVEARDVQAAMELEVEAEVLACVPRPEGLDLFRRCLASGVRVVAISDMYLPGEAVRRILSHCGYPDDLDLWVSADHGATKHVGTLFDTVRAKLGVEPARWLHVGDNAHSDVEVPRRMGLQTLHTPLPPPSRPWEGRGGIVDGIYTRCTSLVSSRRPKLTGPDRFWQHVGCSLAAPLVVGLCAEIRRRADEVGADAICFLARDGLVLLKAYTIMYPDDPRRRIYLHASRRVANFAAVDALDEHAVEFLLGGKDKLTVPDLLTRVGVVSPDVVAAAVSASGVPADEVNPSRDSVRRALSAVSGPLLDAAAAERAAYLGYLEQEGVSTAGRIVVADVGWHCSIQRSLAKLLRLGGSSTSLHGVYLGTKPQAHVDASLDAVGWLYQSDAPRRARDALDRCTEFVELMFASPEHGVHRIVHDGERYVPIRFERPEEMARIEVAAHLHQAVLDVTGLISSARLPEVGLDHSQVCVDRVDLFLSRPDRDSVGFLSALQHSLGFGSTTYRSFVTPVEGWSSAGTILRAMLSSFWREGFVASAPGRYRPFVRLAVRVGIPAYRLAWRAAKVRRRAFSRA